MPAGDDLFDGFQSRDVDVGDVRLHVVIGGSGPPMLLLHGYPQTHAMWHRVAPALAREHTVVIPDLRGYGDSSRPADVGDDHVAYSKRAMAADQLALMTELDVAQFDVAGHDRGARVVHRLCLDAPDRVRRAAVLDIAPTRHVFATADAELAIAYYHWFFLAQGGGLPERLIGADPEHWVRHHLALWSRRPGAFDPRAVAEYVRGFDPAGVHATCEDYRAGAGIDLVHDEADAAAGRRVSVPLLVLYGARGFVGRTYDMAAVWHAYADDIRVEQVDCGHFVAEESAEDTTRLLREFFAP